MENPTAAEAVFPKKSRRVTPLFNESFNRFKSPILHLAAAILLLLQQHVDADEVDSQLKQASARIFGSPTGEVDELARVKRKMATRPRIVLGRLASSSYHPRSAGLIASPYLAAYD
jgi:hypothetical protein